MSDKLARLAHGNLVASITVDQIAGVYFATLSVARIDASALSGISTLTSCRPNQLATFRFQNTRHWTSSESLLLLQSKPYCRHRRRAVALLPAPDLNSVYRIALLPNWGPEIRVSEKPVRSKSMVSLTSRSIPIASSGEAAASTE
jgi:hypothetical protein